jgi:hypothetical protein
MSRTRRFYNKDGKDQIHPYQQICMGNCKMCKNPEKEPKILRKQLKRDFIREIDSILL